MAATDDTDPLGLKKGLDLTKGQVAGKNHLRLKAHGASPLGMPQYSQTKSNTRRDMRDSW